MSDTPRTDKVYDDNNGHGFEMCYALNTLARQLERELATSEAKVKELEEQVSSAYGLSKDAPELNMSNYTHDDVRKLNDAMVEVYMVLRGDRDEI